VREGGYLAKHCDGVDCWAQTTVQVGKWAKIDRCHRKTLPRVPVEQSEAKKKSAQAFMHYLIDSDDKICHIIARNSQKGNMMKPTPGPKSACFHARIAEFCRLSTHTSFLTQNYFNPIDTCPMYLHDYVQQHHARRRLGMPSLLWCVMTLEVSSRAVTRIFGARAFARWILLVFVGVRWEMVNTHFLKRKEVHFV